MPARGIRTEPLVVAGEEQERPAVAGEEQERPAVAVVEDTTTAEPAASTTPADATIELSTGQVATMKETTGLDEEGVERHLVSWGYTLQGLASISYGRILALMAIQTLDGEEYQRPESDVALDAELITFRKRDLMRLQTLYDALNGPGAVMPTPPRPLAPNEVYLSDGRFVTIAEQSGMDEKRSNDALTVMGYTGIGLAELSYTRASALMAIESIDGKKAPPPQTKAQLNERLGIKARDIIRIVAVYIALNGLGGGRAAEETFRL